MWRSLTPSLRGRVLDVLLSRKQWVGPLLAAIEAQTVLTSEIDAAHQARLSEYPDPELRKKAKSSFAQTSSERMAVVTSYQPALKNGDAKRGQAIFQKNCTPCHKFQGIGNEVGPNIAARQDKSNDGLLREILDPNRAVDQHFAAYVAVTNRRRRQDRHPVRRNRQRDHAARPERRKNRAAAKPTRVAHQQRQIADARGPRKTDHARRNGRPDQVPRDAIARQPDGHHRELERC